MPLTFLAFAAHNATDLTVVKDLPNLQKLVFRAKDTKAGWDAIRQHPMLKVIDPDGNWGGNQPAAEFWKRFDAGEFTKVPPK